MKNSIEYLQKQMNTSMLIKLKILQKTQNWYIIVQLGKKMWALKYVSGSDI